MARAEIGEQIEVCVERVRRTEVRVHGGEVESLTEAESHGVGVRVVIDGREGTSNCGSFDSELVDALLCDARDNAGFASPDDRAGIAHPDGHPVTERARPGPGFSATSSAKKFDLALAVERQALDLDRRVRGVRAAVYGDQQVERAVVTSSGIDAEVSSARGALSTSVLINDIDGGTRTGYAAHAGFDPSDLDPEKVATLSVQRGLQLLGATSIASGRLPVVFPPRIAASLIGLVGSMLSGERVVKGRTPFGGRLGVAVADSALTLFDDPTDQRSITTSELDGEGLACRVVPLIGSGMLEGYLHDTKSARGLGVTGTGSAIRTARSSPSPGYRSLHVAAGLGDLESLIADVDDGLLILTLQGLHSGVNQVSGDFSAGVEGIRIRGGALAEPVREATLAGSIPRMLLDIARVGADVEYLPGGSSVPSMTMGAMAIGGSDPR